MHLSVMNFVAECVEKFDLKEKQTLEVGSANVNGSVRPFFHGEYTGVDIVEGSGVDLVASAAYLPFISEMFETVVSIEMLEHDQMPWVSIVEMARVLEPNGLMILACRGFDARGAFPLHNEPDRWRFTVDGMLFLLTWAKLIPILIESDPEVPGVFAIARKI